MLESRGADREFDFQNIFREILHYEDIVLMNMGEREMQEFVMEGSEDRIAMMQ